MRAIRPAERSQPAGPSGPEDAAFLRREAVLPRNASPPWRPSLPTHRHPRRPMLEQARASLTPVLGNCILTLVQTSADVNRPLTPLPGEEWWTPDSITCCRVCRWMSGPDVLAKAHRITAPQPALAIIFAGRGAPPLLTSLMPARKHDAGLIAWSPDTAALEPCPGPGPDGPPGRSCPASTLLAPTAALRRHVGRKGARGVCLPMGRRRADSASNGGGRQLGVA